MSNTDPLPESDNEDGVAQSDIAVSDVVYDSDDSVVSEVGDDAVLESDAISESDRDTNIISNEDRYVSSEVLTDAGSSPELYSPVQPKLEENDAWLKFIEGNQGWLDTLRKELTSYQNVITPFDERRRKDEHDKLWKIAFNALGKLDVISDSIMRLDSDSRCSTSSQAVKEALLSLLNKFRPPSADLNSDNMLIRRQQTFRALLHLGLHEAPPPAGYFNTRTDVLLKMLFSRLTSLSSDLKTFLEKMNIWKSVEMDAVQNSLTSISGFIKHCAKVKFVEGKDMSPTYANDLMQELEKQLIALSEALDELIKSALPAFEEDFRYREKRTLAESFQLLTAATFFSSITASTLAISLGANQQSKLYDGVNFFWFTSLVLSTTSVMNSLLALVWKQPIFRKRSNAEKIKLPPLVAAWSRDSPLYFLVAAALTFIVGLCLLAYASNQPKWISACTTILTGLGIIGIICVTAWFIAEHIAHQMVTQMNAVNSLDTHSVPAGQLRLAESSEERYSSVFSIIFRGLYQEIRGEKHHRENRIGPNLLVGGHVKQKEINESKDMGKSSGGASSGIPMGHVPDKSSMLQKVIKALSFMTPKVLESNDATKRYHESDRSSVRWISFSADGELLGICKRNAVYLYLIPDQKMLQKISSDSVQIRGRPVWRPGPDLQSDKCFILWTTQGFQVWHEKKADDGSREFFRLHDVNVHFHRSFVYGMFPNGRSFWVVTESRIKQYNFDLTSHSTSDGETRENSKPEWESKLLGEVPGPNTGSITNPEMKLELRVHACCFLGGDKENKSHFLISVEYFDQSNEDDKTRNRYELIVYDFQDNKVESRIPLFHPACTLRPSEKDGNLNILVGYSQKPPQLWCYEGLSHGVMCMQPYQVYRYLSREETPKFDGDEVNQEDVFFFGAADEFVGRWVDEGPELAPRLLVWEKSTAMFVCEIPSKWIEKDVTEKGTRRHTFEVNPSYSGASMMFATLASGGGQLSLWTSLTGVDGFDPNEWVDAKDDEETPRVETPKRRRNRLFRGRQHTV